MKTDCIYHRDDFDGICSGAIVKKFIPETILVGKTYGDPIDIMDYYGSTVYMVDFSLEPFSQMVELNKICKLIWIDHHISAIKEYIDYPSLSIDGAREVGSAGCELTWKYFNRVASIPSGVRLLGRYDVYDLENNPKALPFQYGLRSLQPPILDSTHSIWNIILDEKKFTDRRMDVSLCERGYIILSYIKYDNARIIENAFELKFQGYKALVVNTARATSQLFETHPKWKEFDLGIAFTYRKSTKGDWSIQLRSTKIDVGELARKFGGGGHKEAAGLCFSGETLDYMLHEGKVYM